MRATTRRRTVSVRGWFALAAITTFAMVVLAVLAIVLLFGDSDDTSRDRIAHATTVLRDGADQWDDPAWQKATAADLGDDDVSFALYEGTDELYRSADRATGGQAAAADAVWAADRGDGIVRVVEVDGSDPPLTARLYTPLRSDDPLPGIARATVVIGGVAAAVSLAFGRPFVRSLRAVRHAAIQVAEGDMGVALPRSRITEVAEVNTAVDAMATELGRSLEQQAHLEQERRLFIAAVAHDLRTPLFSLRGHLDGLHSGLAGTPEKRARYLAAASEKARELERLVAELFDYTRVEYLDPSLQRSVFDLADLLHDVVVGLQPRADEHGLTLELRSSGQPCRIDADREQLARAATNLVDNALRYTPAGGRVEVTYGTSPDRAWFTVTDTGPGIADADLPHVFQPLYRGQGSEAATAGTGLGLAIAHRVLVAHHGTLTAGNAASGGAVFTAAVPSLEQT